MVSFFGSANGRYFVVQEDNQMSFYRQDIFVWKREIDLTDFSILRVGNNGKTFVLSPDGLFLWPMDPHEPPLLVEEFSQPSMDHIAARLGRLQVGNEGTGICCELIMPRPKSGPFNKPLEEGTMREFLFFDTTSGKQQSFHKLFVPDWLGQSRVWDISRSFGWMVFCEPGKARNTLKFTLVDVQDQVIHHDFSLPATGLRGVWVNNDGTVLVDLVNQNETRMYVVTPAQVMSQLTPPSSYEVKYLGKVFVVLRLTPISHLLFKSFQDSLISHADMTPLEAMGMSWDLHFDFRDEIQLCTWREQKFRLVLTSADRLPTDCKRWQNVATQHVEAVRGGVEVEEDPLEYVDQDRRKRQKEMSKSLVASIHQVKKDRNTTAAQVPAQIRKQLEALKLQFATGQVTREQFETQRVELEAALARLEPNGPPSPIPISQPTSRLTDTRSSGPIDNAPVQPPPPTEPAPPPKIPSSSTTRLPGTTLGKKRPTVIDLSAAAPPPTEAAAPPSLPSRGVRPTGPTSREFSPDRQKTEALLEALEEKFILGSITESTYLELREKYLKRSKDQ